MKEMPDKSKNRGSADSEEQDALPSQASVRQDGQKDENPTADFEIAYPTQPLEGEQTRQIKEQLHEIAQDLAGQNVTPEQLAAFMSSPENQAQHTTNDVENEDSESKSGSKSTDPLIGQVIDEKYKILAILGEGGMGRVYKAEHVTLKKYYALKVMRPEKATKGDSIRRFQREAMAASKIGHPNCVAVSNFGIWKEDLFYMVMDYAPGPSLAQIIHQGDRRIALSPKRALPIFIQICAGLDAAHKLGIVHRDVKPSNIILVSEAETDDFVKITDFGIAKVPVAGERTLTTKGELFGSPPYMSPEQCLGEDLDARSDIYSLGCLMYEALNGRVPFAGKMPFDTIMMHTSVEPEVIIFDSDVKPTVAKALNEVIVSGTMAKDRAKRPQTMMQLQAELELINRALDEPSYSSQLLTNLTHITRNTGQVVTTEKHQRKTIGLPSTRVSPALYAPLALAIFLAAFLIVSTNLGIFKAVNGPPESERVLLVTPTKDKSLAPKDNASEDVFAEFTSRKKNSTVGEDLIDRFQEIGKRDLLAGNYQRSRLAFGNANLVSQELVGLADFSKVIDNYCYLSESFVCEGQWDAAKPNVVYALNLLKGTRRDTGPSACFAYLEAAQLFHHAGNDIKAATYYGGAAHLIRGGALFRFPVSLKALFESRVAQFFRGQSDYSQAKEFLDLGFSGWGEVGGAQAEYNQAILLNDYALMAIAEKKPTLAFQDFDKSLVQISKLKGVDDPAYVKVLFNKADLEWSLKRHVQAILDRISAWYIWYKNQYDKVSQGGP
jgi:serine/threonine protein kinase